MDKSFKIELDIQEIFASLQGEGARVGTPAVFIRLGNCNLSCSFCDTEFNTHSPMAIDEIISEVVKLSANVRKLVVITGGEPFMQSIEGLCKALLKMGFIVQIETNGTLYKEVDERVEIVCSPKNHGKGYKKIRLDLIKHVTALKFIISANKPCYGNVTDVGQKEYDIPVYVQPMDENDDEKNSQNMKLALEFCDKYGYNLSIQMHKIIGIK